MKMYTSCNHKNSIKPKSADFGETGRPGSHRISFKLDITVGNHNVTELHNPDSDCFKHCGKVV